MDKIENNQGVDNMLENSVKEYIQKKLQEEGKTLSEKELVAITNDITCTVADTIDQELQNKLV